MAENDYFDQLAAMVLPGMVPVPLSSWQSIETAPKDTSVLVAFDGGAVWILSLVDVYGRTLQHPDNPVGDYDRKRLGIKHCYEWRDDSGDGAQDYRPTHWMPLPDPPKVEAAA